MVALSMTRSLICSLAHLLAATSQFSNIVLTGCVERIVHGARFADQPIGVSLIRGDNIVLLAELVCPLF